MESQVDEAYESEERNPATSISPVEVVRYVVQAARRHVVLGGCVAGGVFVMGLCVAITVPLKFESSSRIYLDENAAKTEALSNLERTPNTADSLTGPFELLMQKTSLTAMVDETGLITDWKATRPLLLRLKDKLMAVVFGAPTHEDEVEGLAKVLSKSIFPNREKNIVTLRVNWRDPRVAYRLAKYSQSKLIDIARTRDTSAYSAAISILEEEATRQGEAIESAMKEASQTRDRLASSVLGTALPSASEASSPTTNVSASPIGLPGKRLPARADARSATSSGGPGVSAQLAEITSQIRTVEEQWHRRQVDLAARLAELKAVYGPEHPAVVQQMAQIEAAKAAPPELAQLQQKRAKFLDDVQSGPDANPYDSPDDTKPIIRAGGSRAAAAPTSRLAPLDARGAQDIDADPAVATAKAKLTKAIDDYNRVSARLASARLQFATAQAAFNSKFVVTGEPEVPIKPLAPLRHIISIASLLLAAVGALIAGAIRELMTGRIHDAWQIKRLDLPVLGELNLPASTALSNPRRPS